MSERGNREVLEAVVASTLQKIKTHRVPEPYRVVVSMDYSTQGKTRITTFAFKEAAHGVEVSAAFKNTASLTWLEGDYHGTQSFLLEELGDTRIIPYLWEIPEEWMAGLPEPEENEEVTPVVVTPFETAHPPVAYTTYGYPGSRF